MGWGTTRAAMRRARVMAALGAVVVAGAAHASPPTVAVRVLPEGGGADARMAGQLVDDAAPRTVKLVPVAKLAAAAPKGAPDPLEDRARSLELKLRFRKAAAVWQQLLDRLVASPALVLDPGHIARVQVALAAAYAEAGEPDLAVLQFREALALDAGFHPGPAYPPRVRAIFARAKAAGPALPPTPSDAVLDQVATSLGARGVLWVAVGREDGQRVLVRRLHLRGASETSAEVRTRIPADASAAKGRLEAAGSRLRAELATAFPAPAPPPPPAVPFFHRTWVLATGAGVLAAVVAGVVAAETLGPRRVTVVVKH